MKIKRTFDKDVIDSVLKHPSIKPFIGDDQSGDVEFPVIDHIYYLAAWEGDTIAGIFVVFGINGITADAHSSILPGFYGEKAREAGREAIRWVFMNTGFHKINGSTPVCNLRAVRYAEDIGFSREGLNKSSYMRNGKLYDQIYFGVERASWA